MYRRIASMAVLLAVAGVGVAGVATAAGTGAEGSQVAVTPVTVTMDEFTFKLSKKTVKKGTRIKFNVVNKGALGHDFDITGVKNMPVIGPKAKFSYTVSFKKAGKFRYVCTVPQHIGYGMSGNLTVK